ncbi:hypothetical protein PRK78_005725 [Emydomyces testavorans]|uniref:Uncharacterized protein n=1 Tax=Emydomyces testavorans TaxID=2070801 RepID=A0AAF0DK66_9EURO|nr:hypothetical protein PRK78_005725 [Emydomyces testavorans]
MAGQIQAQEEQRRQQGRGCEFSAEMAAELAAHLALVDGHPADAEKAARKRLVEQLQTAPLHSSKVRVTFDKKVQPQAQTEEVFPQYGLIGKRVATYGYQSGDGGSEEAQDNLVYTNTNAPWSSFICGSQGSGKSHTLSCMLENALLAPSQAGKLAEPLAGFVLHYDGFSNVSTSQPCEAAYLCSAGIPVRVLVSPSHYENMKRVYGNLRGLPEGAPRPIVSWLKFSEKHLNVTMMKTLMAAGGESQQPLYMELVTRILREMATEDGNSSIDFNKFKRKLDEENLMGYQRSGLDQRMGLLESFLEIEQVPIYNRWANARTRTNVATASRLDEMWEFKKGSLTIVDLSCPFIAPNDACALFNICLKIFLDGRESSGRIIAMDEAHKFLTITNREALELTESLLSIIRQQRHLGTRVIIATQEPALSPKLMDLCDVTMVHRFTSPEWYKTLEGHLAGAVVGMSAEERSKSDPNNLFSKIVLLETGEALVFSANGVLDIIEKAAESDKGESEKEGSRSIQEDGPSETNGAPAIWKLGPRYIKMKVRMRLTADGGRSILAT